MYLLSPAFNAVPSPSLARLSTILGRYSPMRLHITGRKGTPGTFLCIGTRFYYTGVRKMKLGNDDPSPGWVRNDSPVNRSFSCSSHSPLVSPHLVFLSWCPSPSLLSPLHLSSPPLLLPRVSIRMDPFRSSASQVPSSLFSVVNYVLLKFP